MAKQVKHRRGTTAQVAAMTPAEGEIVIDTTKDTACVGDGATAGGNELARSDGSNVSSFENDFAVGGVVGATSAVTAYATGAIKASTGSSGATASTSADEGVFEGSGDTGISALGGDANNVSLYLGSVSDNKGLYADWNHDSSRGRIGTSKVGAQLQLRSDAEVTNLTLSGASGSELGQFAGKIGVKTNSSGYAIDIEENSGSESWQLGVDSVGSLNFHDSDSANWKVKFTDGMPDSSFSIDSSGNVIAGNSVTVTDFLRIPSKGELTIASGVITVTGSDHGIDTESNTSSDDLDTINGGTSGDILYLTAWSPARTVVLKDGTGNLSLDGDFSMDNNADVIVLKYTGSIWLEVTRSNNGA